MSVWIKINDYQTIAIYMEKKFQQASQEHNHIRTLNFAWKTLQCRGQNYEAVSKNIYYEIEITTLKIMPKLSPQ